MTEAPAKKESSILALKNSARHLNEIYAAIDKANTAMTISINRLEELGKSCSNIAVPIYNSHAGRNEYKNVLTIISETITSLSGAKING